jgi:hypothetical protein
MEITRGKKEKCKFPQDVPIKIKETIQDRYYKGKKKIVNFHKIFP